MNLSQLYSFKKLAELQHYTRAAKELYIAQPTLSDAISSLEKELGVALFCRDGRSVRLTSNGSEFYRYVSDSLRSLDDGIDAMNRRKEQLGGTINLGATFTVQDDYLPTLLKAYRERFGDEVRIEDVYKRQPLRFFWRSEVYQLQGASPASWRSDLKMTSGTSSP